MRLSLLLLPSLLWGLPWPPRRLRDLHLIGLVRRVFNLSSRVSKVGCSGMTYRFAPLRRSSLLRHTRFTIICVIILVMLETGGISTSFSGRSFATSSPLGIKEALRPDPRADDPILPPFRGALVVLLAPPR